MRKSIVKLSVLLIFTWSFFKCGGDTGTNNDSNQSEFYNEQKVTITGYDSDAMEPFISKDGNYLFFNNEHGSAGKDIFYAQYINDTTFMFKGEVQGINTPYVEATPSLDNASNFFFISTRDLDTTNKTLFFGVYEDGRVSNTQRIKGTINIPTPYWINMGSKISNDGNILLVSNAKFNKNGQFDFEGNIRMAVKSGTEFNIPENESKILKNINTDDAAQYAAELSVSGLELFYSQVSKNSSVVFKLCHSKRKSLDSAFEKPTFISEPFKNNPSAVVEGPTLSADGTRLYYHKKENDKFSIFMLSRKPH